MLFAIPSPTFRHPFKNYPNFEMIFTSSHFVSSYALPLVNCCLSYFIYAVLY